MSRVGAWLKAFRLRTLPLAFSSIILGSFLARHNGYFDISVLIYALLTTLFMQILSNLANDYGDTIHGVDNHQRVGPKRTVQSGEITLTQMKWGIVIFTILSLLSGIWLLVIGTKGINVSSIFILLGIGLLAIAAAIKYTIGKNPYGYIGLGDIAVFLFFGLTGVIGTYFLHTHRIDALEFLPAISVGLLSTGVLNLNNLRDRDNDRVSGKITMVVRLGIEKARMYHALLLGLAMASAVIYTFLNYNEPGQFLYLLSFPLFIMSIRAVYTNTDPGKLDPELKKLALATLLFAVTFGVGLIL
ncbi:MAG: 1,4-dihydroxy-2-naphthoate polyprenyltransferase [Ginsengibacter sp.]